MPDDNSPQRHDAARALRWCRICERVGKKMGWPEGDALIGPRGTRHFQKDEDWADTTVCGLDATKGGWLWPTGSAARTPGRMPEHKMAPCPHCGAPEAPERMDSPLRKLTFLIVRAAEHTRDPIDQNYVAIPRDAWEDMLAAVNHG